MQPLMSRRCRPRFDERGLVIKGEQVEWERFGRSLKLGAYLDKGAFGASPSSPQLFRSETRACGFLSLENYFPQPMRDSAFVPSETSAP